MADSNPRRSAMLLHFLLASIFAVEGALILARGLSAERDALLVAFGATEVISAALFIWPRTLRIGACGLVCAFLVAAVFHIIEGEFPSEHLIAAVAVAVVTIHSAGWSFPYRGAAA